MNMPTPKTLEYYHTLGARKEADDVALGYTPKGADIAAGRMNLKFVITDLDYSGITDPAFRANALDAAERGYRGLPLEA